MIKTCSYLHIIEKSIFLFKKSLQLFHFGDIFFIACSLINIYIYIYINFNKMINYSINKQLRTLISENKVKIKN